MLLAFNLEEYFSKDDMLGKVLELLIFSAIAFVVTFILLKIEKRIFAKRMLEKKSIKLRFTRNVIRIVIITVAVVWVLTSSSATADFGKTIFQGTTIMAAVIGLAAGPVISDLFCGLMISINKPFEIGDRVEMDNGVMGIVTDITQRHVVIKEIDSVVRIIPNSKVNSCVIRNMSYNTRIRSIHFRFNVAYGTDVEKAMAVIRKAVEESPLTIPAWKNKKEYGPVYFIAYEDSSLVMATTVYFQPDHPSEEVKSDINLRVMNAMKEAGIEIPFRYINVVMKDGA
ncbi:MAG: mechanosensitive ion channel family protein [Eubacterium sp.]|nr:mechanosensitive ion channel family protein [Eubacterium sp.]